jgi:Fe-S cluster biogenesis protein NfuA
VTVRLQGACAGCPMSQMTLKNGIEKILKKEIPEVIAVESAP